MADHDTSFEIDILPTKRKRSSILKPPEKRASRDSRTVSFNDKCIYKELHPDGTCDLTNIFLRQDMDLTLMDVVEPADMLQNQTINSSMDMSIVSQENNNQDQTNEDCSMDLTLISQFQNSMPKTNTIELPSVDYDTSTIYDKKMSLDISSISSLNSTLKASYSIDSKQFEVNDDSSYRDNTLSQSPVPQRDSTTMLNCSMTRISDVSSLSTVAEQQSMNETMFGAFHESNISINSRTSAMDTLIQNVEVLNDCIQKIDQDLEECKGKLDEEMSELFRFYRHVINKNNKYEFAIRIFGLRYNLWLLIKLNPETYPNEKIGLRFAVNKKDRHLYPFPEYAEAVRRCTQEGREGYLTRFVINAQRFRRFLRVIGYKKPNKV